MIKGPDSRRHIHINWGDIMKKWGKAAKSDDPGQAVRGAVQHILYVKLPAP